MITTLLKHEFIRTRGMLAAIVGIGTLLTAVATVMTATGWMVISHLGAALAFFAVSVLVPAIQVGLAFDFWFSSFRRTGYFTQTLPIKGSTIYWSKTLWGSLVTLAGLVVSGLLFALFWVAFGPNLTLSRNVFADAGSLFALIPTWLTVSMAVFLLVSCLGWLVQLYFAATIGSNKALGRLSIGGPIIVYMVMYVAGQVIVLAGMFLIPLGLSVSSSGVEFIVAPWFSDLATQFELTSDMNGQGMTGSGIVPLGFIPPLVLIFVVSIWWSVRNWNRKVALA